METVENKVSEGEVIEPINSEDKSENPNAGRNIKKGRSDFYIELALFLILGILVGIAVKTEAVKRITIGYDDYKMNIMTASFDINKLQTQVIQKQTQDAAQQQQAAPSQDSGKNANPTDGSDSQNSGNGQARE